MKDAPAQADTYAELGHLLIGWRDPSAPAVAAEDADSGSRGHAQQSAKGYAQQSSDLPGLAAKLAGVVNGGANVSPDDLDSLRRLNVTDGELKGLKFYGDAVRTYRQVGDNSAAAAVFNEVGEHFSKSGSSFAPVSLNVEKLEGFLRAQAAVALFCAAGSESARDADRERRIVSLIEVGKRLAGMTDAEEEEDEEVTTRASAGGPRPFTGRRPGTSRIRPRCWSQSATPCRRAISKEVTI